MADDSTKPQATAPGACESFEFRSIGHVRTPYTEKFGTPRQSNLVNDTTSTFELREDLNPEIFDGLESYSHVWLIFVFDRNGTQEFKKVKVHPPRLGGAAVGVFATRSPHRPNPIGLSLARLLRRDGRRLFFAGLDLLDGTAILDIKPHLPSREHPAEAHEGWSANLAEKTLQVSWLESAQADLHHAFGVDAETAKRAITQILEQDPRPVVYRGHADNPNPYTSRYGFVHAGWNVVFDLPESNQARVLALTAWPQTQPETQPKAE